MTWETSWSIEKIETIKIWRQWRYGTRIQTQKLIKNWSVVAHSRMSRVTGKKKKKKKKMETSWTKDTKLEDVQEGSIKRRKRQNVDLFVTRMTYVKELTLSSIKEKHETSDIFYWIIFASDCLDLSSNWSLSITSYKLIEMNSLDDWWKRCWEP